MESLIKLYAVKNPKCGTDIYKDKEMTNFCCHNPWRTYRVQQVVEINNCKFNLIPMKIAISSSKTAKN